MTPDPSWLAALKLPTQVIFGLFLACIALLGLDWAAVLPLSKFGEIAKPSIIVLSVVFAALSLTGAVTYFMEQHTRRKTRALAADRRLQRGQDKKDSRANAQQVALGRIDYLNPQELRYLADCLRKNSQSFYTYLYSPAVKTLIGKGLVYTPGGTHNQDQYPFTILDFAWKALLGRKEEIIAKDAVNRKNEEKYARR